jgi:predicted ATP-binding protein involved in virulence
MPLFPGKSCFPLSPDKASVQGKKVVAIEVSNGEEGNIVRKFPVNDSDQLAVILGLIE